VSNPISLNEPGPSVTINPTPKRRWYIAGPMRGMDRLNRPAFYTAATRLRKAGHEAVNPFELTLAEDLSIRDYMKVDLPALLECNGVALLPGWEKSKGARVEALVAWECGLAVHTLNCLLSYPLSPTCNVNRERILEAFTPATTNAFINVSIKGPGGPVRISETILEEAVRITSRDRQSDYGHPADHFQRTVDAINAIFKDKLKEPLVATDWPLILVLDKVSRESNKHKRDNLTDIAGYARTAEMIHDRDEDARAER